MKKLVSIISFVLIISSAIVSSFSINASNVSMKEAYIPGDIIEGSFNVKISDAPINSVFSSVFGNVSIRDFLRENGMSLPCESYNCSGIYTATSKINDPLEKTLSSGGDIYGFNISGENINIVSLSFNISSTFGEKDNSPFGIQIGETYSWEYSSFSDNFNNYRNITYGCFNGSKAYNNNTIDEASIYCETINLSSSDRYFLGANISGGGLADFTMILKQGNTDKASCDFTKTTAEYSDVSGCNVTFGEPIISREYSVCIKAKSSGTGYKVKREDGGLKCGHLGNINNKIADYSLFVITPKYASSSGIINLSSDFGSRSAGAINAYLNSRYNKNCTSGCVVPIKIYGEGISISLSNIMLKYTSQFGSSDIESLHNIAISDSKINFNGTINMSKFGWIYPSFRDILFNVSVGGLGIVSKNLKSINDPLINNITPKLVPVGVPVILYADIINIGVVNNNTSISYAWNFGDGTSVVSTNNSSVIHIFRNNSEYNVTLTFKKNNYTTSKSFNITGMVPDDYINTSINIKMNKLNNLSSSLNILPNFVKSVAELSLGISSIRDKINHIDVAYNTSYTDDDKVSLINELLSISIPEKVFLSKNSVQNIIFFSGGMKLDYAKKHYASSVSDLDKYKPFVLGWQSEYLNESSVNLQEFKVVNEDGTNSSLLTYYNINIKSSSDDKSNLFIQSGLSDLHLSSGINSKNIDNDAVAIEIQSKGSLSFELYTNHSTPLVMYVSPSFSSISTNKEIEVCNFNFVCEAGEDYKNCPSDCKSVSKTMFWAILFLVIAIIISIFIYIWHKKNYEKYLFKNEVDLTNIIAFVENARKSKISDNKIRNNLLNKGWGKDQIRYAMKNAGKNKIANKHPIEKSSHPSLNNTNNQKPITGFASAGSPSRPGNNPYSAGVRR